MERREHRAAEPANPLLVMKVDSYSTRSPCFAAMITAFGSWIDVGKRDRGVYQLGGAPAH
jgi:hypothetical protein